VLCPRNLLFYTIGANDDVTSECLFDAVSPDCLFSCDHCHCTDNLAKSFSPTQLRWKCFKTSSLTSASRRITLEGGEGEGEGEEGKGDREVHYTSILLVYSMMWDSVDFDLHRSERAGNKDNQAEKADYESVMTDSADFLQLLGVNLDDAISGPLFSCINLTLKCFWNPPPWKANYVEVFSF